MHADAYQEERDQLNTALRRSQELLRQATALMAQVEEQREADAHTLAVIQQLLLDSAQFRTEFYRVLQHSSPVGHLPPND